MEGTPQCGISHCICVGHKQEARKKLVLNSAGVCTVYPPFHMYHHTKGFFDHKADERSFSHTKEWLLKLK